jgi:predicted ATPase
MDGRLTVLKLKITKVGRISEAVVDLKKITMFLGKNDTGKTYAASTIWAFIEFINGFPDNKEILKSAEVAKLISELSSEIHVGSHSATVTASQLNALQRSTVEYFNRNVKKILEASIGYDGFGASKVDILDFEHQADVYVTFKIEEYRSIESSDIEGLPAETNRQMSNDPEEDAEEIQYEENFLNFECDITDDEGEIFNIAAEGIPGSLFQDHMLQDVREQLIGFACFGRDWKYLRNTLYVPAARTGIMLSLNYFVEGAMQRSSRRFSEIEREIRHELPEPIQSFASKLIRPYFQGQGRFTATVASLLKGELKRSKRRGVFLFTPEGSRREIPLSSASSLVTELAALSLMSRQFVRPTFLIFEEPEAHLHLEAQREMARFLAQLSKGNVRILVTTHSDTFIQQINNLVTLSDHPFSKELRSRFDLSDEDIIQRDSISAYDFECVNGDTKVKELELTRTGFVAESLNDVLRRLAIENLAIAEGIGDEIPDASKRED